MIPHIVTRAARKIKRFRPWFKAATEIVALRDASRFGGLLDKAVAGAAMVGSLAGAIAPTESIQDTLCHEGFKEVNSNIGGFLCEVLLGSTLPVTVTSADALSQTFLYVWKDRGFSIAAIFESSGEYVSGPFVKGSEEDLRTSIHHAVWNGLDLVVTASARSHWRGAKQLHLDPLPEPGPFIGKPGPEEISKRLLCCGLPPGTLLIRGTTGSGKSVLARRIAQATPNGNGRTLKISDSVLKYCTLDKVSSLVKYLSPSVILIDDFGVREDLTLEDLLALLELVRPPDSLLILTMMTGSEPSRRLSPGSRYLTGMRPGRIDEIVDIYLPDLPLRRKILKYYFDSSSFRISEGTLDSIARATKGLSGAYLAEVARRISARGVSQWHGEVTQVLSMAPKPGGRT